MRKRASERMIDLGDELLVQIIKVVRDSPLPVARKLKTLVRAGKIGEMNLGPYADDCAYRAFSPSARLLSSPKER